MHQYDIVLDVTVMNRTGDPGLLSTVESVECWLMPARLGQRIHICMDGHRWVC